MAAGGAVGQAPPAPTISALHAGDEALTVVWTAPEGVTGVMAYDLRWILTSADETVDSNWTVEEDVWTEGELLYVLFGLINGSGYDVQVRAVTDADGAWSTTVGATPAEPINVFVAAVALPLGLPVGAVLTSPDDYDLFRFTLTEETGVILFTRGPVDTVGVLYDEDAVSLDANDDGGLGGEPWNFAIGTSLDAGTYYVQVSGAPLSGTGTYTVHAGTIRDTTGRGTAQEVALGSTEVGLFESKEDRDYFRFTLEESANVSVRSGGPFTDAAAELLNSSGNHLATNDDGFLPGMLRQFVLQKFLPAGVYYVKVYNPTEAATGVYSFRLETVGSPGSVVGSATSLDLDEIETGNIRLRSDAHYFRIDRPRATQVWVRAVSDRVNLSGTLLDSNGDSVEANVSFQSFRDEGMKGFTISRRLDAGTHYLKVAGSSGLMPGNYAIRMVEDEEMNDVVAECSSLPAPFSDPLSGCQWNLQNEGQFGGPPGEDIRVEAVWSGGNLGAGITVAVVDDGLDEGHPDLVDNVDASRGHDYRGAGLLATLSSHGTSTAGIVAARDNDLGGRGVAPRATVYGYNFLRTGADAHSIDAMTRNMATTAVSTNSYGFSPSPGLNAVVPGWERAVRRGVTTGYGGKGVSYVWSAGNGHLVGDHTNLGGHTNLYAVTTVCAVNDRGQRSEYSEQGASLWLCAPSRDGFVSRPSILAPYNYGRYGDFGGTSAAAPTVAGVVALVRAANPDLTWRDVKLILAASARKNDASNGGWNTGGQKYDASGSYYFNHEYGFGVVDAKAAVDLAEEWTNLPAFIETDPVEATPNLAIPDAGTGGPGARRRSSVTVGTEVEFVEFVEINTDFDARAFRDLQMELVSPSNAVSVLSVPYPVSDPDAPRFGLRESFRFGSARHLGENPAGTWTLRMSDHVRGGAAGTLRSWSLKIYGHRSTPGAPEISFIGPGRGELAVHWTAPSVIGALEVTSFDVRHILRNAADKSDGNWTLRKGVGSPGSLSYTVTGLLDNTKYDVQVRAVNDQGSGAWSETVVAETLPNRAPLPVGSLVGPDLQVGDGTKDVDVSRAFEDPDGDTLTYDASSSAPGIAQAWASGSQVTLTPVSQGNATITVTATDVGGSNTPATQTFDVRVKGRRGVTISRAALTVDEGSSNSYTVVLDSEPSGPVTVTASVPANTDVSVEPTALTFTAGDWRFPKTVLVEAAEDTDTVADAPVTISHRVSGADYGSVRASSVQVTIVETDTPTLSVEAAEAPEGGGTIVFRVTLSTSSGSDVTVDYATFDGSGSAGARAGSDYTEARGTLTFPVGLTAAQQIFVALIDDADDEEEEETFRLTLSNAQHASLAGGGSTLEVTGRIRDDDDPEVEVSFGSATYEAREGGTATVVVRLDRDPERDLDIDLVRTHHGGATDADYSGVPADVTFGRGVRTQEFLFAATDDTADDDGEAVVLTFGFLPWRVTGSGETTLAIGDNDGSGGGDGTGGGGGGGGGGPPPSDDEDDDEDEDDSGGGAGGGGPPPPSGPPKADFTLTAECAGDLCRARTGLPVTFEDTSAGRVQSRRWDFGDGTGSRNRRIDHAWGEPGFYEVTLSVSDGTTTSTAKQVFLVEASDSAGTCVADAETLCLQDSRYSVAVEWRTADGRRGPGSVVHEGTNDSGLFTFFSADNWEVLIKVLDGCTVNGHVWVYGASTTDLGYVIRVTDTVTGTVKEYRNEPGLPAPAITDATAFHACAR